MVVLERSCTVANPSFQQFETTTKVKPLACFSNLRILNLKDSNFKTLWLWPFRTNSNFVIFRLEKNHEETNAQSAFTSAAIFLCFCRSSTDSLKRWKKKLRLTRYTFDLGCRGHTHKITHVYAHWILYDQSAWYTLLVRHEKTHADCFIQDAALLRVHVVFNDQLIVQ